MPIAYDQVVTGSFRAGNWDFLTYHLNYVSPNRTDFRYMPSSVAEGKPA